MTTALLHKMAPVECAYIAGFFDGEGYVAYKGGTLAMQIVQKRREVLDIICAKVGGKVYPKSGVLGFTLNINGIAAAILVRQMLPYLIVKRVEALRACVAFWKNRRMCDAVRYSWPPKSQRRMYRLRQLRSLCHGSAAADPYAAGYRARKPHHSQEADE